MKKFDVIAIGSALKDIFILNKDMSCSGTKVCHPFNPEVLGDKIKIKKMYFDIGGGGTNTAATFGNMGLKTALVTRVGDDLAGKEIFKTMKKFKVNTELITRDKKEETGYSVKLNQDNMKISRLESIDEMMMRFAEVLPGTKNNLIALSMK